MKAASFKKIEQAMQDMDKSSFRYRTLDCAKKFKTSWIELAQVLYSVWKDKLYREWGYTTFDAYTAREIGLRKQTAMKLLRSYFFLEKEEPVYLSEEYKQSADAASLPTYEAVDVLRLAQKNKMLDEEDYSNLKDKVLKRGKDARDVKKDLTALIKQREELEPEEARRKKEVATLRRFLSTLKSLKRDIEFLKVLPAATLEEITRLIQKIEDRI